MVECKTMMRYFLLLIILHSKCSYAAKIQLYNQTKSNMLVKIKVKGAKDEDVMIEPLYSYTLDRIIGKVDGIVINGKEFKAQDSNQYSYSLNADGKPLFKENFYGAQLPFSFIVISDLHTKGATEQEMQNWINTQRTTLNKDIDNLTKELALLEQKSTNTTGIASKKTQIDKKNKEITALSTELQSPQKHAEKTKKIIDYIRNNSDKNIRAVLVTGDMVWWNHDPKTEFNAFKKLYYDPIHSVLKTVGGRIYTILGNHDKYCGGACPSLNFTKNTYGNNFYSFDIHGVHFVTPGMFPQPVIKEGAAQLAPQLFNPYEGSIDFLESDLKKVPKEVPVIIFMHFPVESKWWEREIKEVLGHAHPMWDDKQKDDRASIIAQETRKRFYNALEGHTIIGIIVGHDHSVAKQTINNGKYTQYKIGSHYCEPVLFTFDPTNTTKPLTTQNIQ